MRPWPAKDDDNTAEASHSLLAPCPYHAWKSIKSSQHSLPHNNMCFAESKWSTNLLGGWYWLPTNTCPASVWSVAHLCKARSVRSSRNLTHTSWNRDAIAAYTLLPAAAAAADILMIICRDQSLQGLALHHRSFHPLENQSHASEWLACSALIKHT